MFLCYIDESGTPEAAGNTSHYVLAGISIPIEKWKVYDGQISDIKGRAGLADAEIHTAWLLRGYREQSLIPRFDSLSPKDRIFEVERSRMKILLSLQAAGKSKKEQYKQQKKNFRHTQPYIHLSGKERAQFVNGVANAIGGWSDVRLFADCIDKTYYDPAKQLKSVDEQAFEQVVSRFETYVEITSKARKSQNFGLLIHDNNETVARKHTRMMKGFHKSGTLWKKISHIVDTPFFVSSDLTSMVQLADLCAYALRRYLENGETGLFASIFKRADQKDGTVVGVRHFTEKSCPCVICAGRKKKGA